MSLILTDITFRYPKQDQAVLQDFSLTIEPGEAVAIMAPSGAGKSTVLGVAGLLLSPERGDVQLAGERVTPRMRTAVLGVQICYIFQSIQLLPRRTVLDNIALPSLTHGVRPSIAYAAARKYAEELGIGEYLDRPARHLSGGQAQRVGIARALAPEPALVIADEPTANLDQATAQDVGALLFGMDRLRTSILLATHDPAIAAHADRICRLDAP